MTKLMTACLALMLSGCSTFAVPRYAADAETVATLREIGEVKVAVGAFTSGPGDRSAAGSITCRAVGPIKTPDGELFSAYVRKALVSELIIANLYSSNAPVTLTGSLDVMDFSSHSGQWNLALRLASSNGQAVSVADQYKFTTSFFGETACAETAQALLGATQELIKKAVRSPAFADLLR